MTIARKKTSVLHYTVHHNLIGTCYMRKPLLLLVLALHAAIPLTSYADYLVVVPTTKAQKAADLALNLNGGALPAAIKGELYSESLNKYLRVTGDPMFKDSDVSWSLTSGKLPDGMSLDGGAISGTAVQKGQTTFEVLASYKDKTGQQAYTLNVGGRVLQVRSIDAGSFHTCAVTVAGGVMCWGYYSAGPINTNVPINAEGLSENVKNISIGSGHSCVETSVGGVKCWGDNHYGQLGISNAITNSRTPVDMPALPVGVSSVSVGDRHSCALTTTGAIKCWGDNSLGQLGRTDSPSSWVPVDVSGLTFGATSVVTGANHTCALTTTGGVKCWGHNGSGQLGDSSRVQRGEPVDVLGLTSGVASIAAGLDYTCAVTVTGGAKCWGGNHAGQLGFPGGDSTIPNDVTGLSIGVKSVTASSSHTCAITVTGGAKCWGENYSGQLGFPGGNSMIPVDIPGITDVALVALGLGHTCIASTAGTIKCWGEGSWGQLGDGSSTSRHLPGGDIEY